METLECFEKRLKAFQMVSKGFFRGCMGCQISFMEVLGGYQERFNAFHGVSEGNRRVLRSLASSQGILGHFRRIRSFTGLHYLLYEFHGTFRGFQTFFLQVIQDVSGFQKISKGFPRHLGLIAITLVDLINFTHGSSRSLHETAQSLVPFNTPVLRVDRMIYAPESC